jgi:hypothetical protein
MDRKRRIDFLTKKKQKILIFTKFIIKKNEKNLRSKHTIKNRCILTGAHVVFMENSLISS